MHQEGWSCYWSLQVQQKVINTNSILFQKENLFHGVFKDWIFTFGWTIPLSIHLFKPYIFGGWDSTVSTHINSGLQLMQRDPTTVAQHLSANVLADGGGSWLTADKQVVSKKKSATLCFSEHRCSPAWHTLTVQMQQHVGLEQIFSPCHLALRHTRAKRRPDGGATRLMISSHMELLWFYI